VDERVREHLATDEISIGDYVLTGGELPAMVIIDAVARQVPGVLPAWAVRQESHVNGMLEYPHYTRPADFRGWRVPDVLLNGNHAEIERWRHEQSELRTWQRRQLERRITPLNEGQTTNDDGSTDTDALLPDDGDTGI
jgi:tRNA (guanine37-N1)-methyltransferase